jgi:MFS family permease
VATRDSGELVNRPFLRLGAFRSRWTLASIAALLYWLAVQALRPYVAMRLASLGASTAQISFAVAAHPFLSLFLAIPAGRLIDRRGLRVAMISSLAAMGVVGVGYALATTTTQLVMLQLAAGLTELGGWIGIQALLTRAGEGSFRHQHLALFSVMWGIGIALGPSVGAWAFDGLGFEAVGLLYGFCGVVAALLLTVVPYRDRRVPPAALERMANASTFRGVVEVGRSRGVLAVLVASFVALWANSLRTSFYPLYLETSGVSLRAIGLLMSVGGVMILLGRLPLSWLVRRYRSGPVLVVGTAISVLSLAATPLFVISPLLLAAASASYGLGFGLNSPLTIDLMAEHSDDAQRGLAMGMRVASNRAAQVLQPLLFGAVAGPLGMAVSFGVSGVVMGVGTATMASWLRGGRVAS